MPSTLSQGKAVRARVKTGVGVAVAETAGLAVALAHGFDGNRDGIGCEK